MERGRMRLRLFEMISEGAEGRGKHRSHEEGGDNENGDQSKETCLVGPLAGQLATLRGGADL